jgi:hypothetical protein
MPRAKKKALQANLLSFLNSNPEVIEDVRNRIPGLLEILNLTNILALDEAENDRGLILRGKLKNGYVV